MPDTAALAAREKRKARSRDARAARIVEAAGEVLATSGMNGLTMRAVAGRAGYTAGAVYGYFSSREALLAALAVDELDALAKTLRQHPASLRDISQICTDALRRVVPLLAAAGRADVPPDTERALTGRVIAVLRQLDAAVSLQNGKASEPASAADIIALWAGLTGFALLAGSGRLRSLNVDDDAVLSALVARFES